jgi:hypothetical protein
MSVDAASILLLQIQYESGIQSAVHECIADAVGNIDRVGPIPDVRRGGGSRFGGGRRVCGVSESCRVWDLVWSWVYLCLALLMPILVSYPHYVFIAQCSTSRARESL